MKYYQKIFVLSLLLSSPLLSYADALYCPAKLNCDDKGYCTDGNGKRPPPWNFNSSTEKNVNNWLVQVAVMRVPGSPVECYYVGDWRVTRIMASGNWIADYDAPGNSWEPRHDNLSQCHSNTPSQCPFKSFR